MSLYIFGISFVRNFGKSDIFFLSETGTGQWPMLSYRTSSTATEVGITGERGGGLTALVDFLFDGLPQVAAIIS